MNFEIVDNIFQILVLFCVMIASAVTACKKKKQGLSAPCRQLRLLYDGNALLCPVSYHYGKGTADFLCGGDFLAGCIFVLFIALFIPKGSARKASRCCLCFGGSCDRVSGYGFSDIWTVPVFFWLLWNYCRYHCPSVYGSAKKRKRTSFSGRNYAVSGMAAGIVVYCV